MSLFLALTLLTTSLALCNAHSAQSDHQDCAQCVRTTSASEEGDPPRSLPARPHHCPHHACPHLHFPYLVQCLLFVPVFNFAVFTISDISFQLPPCSLSIFQPPKA